jgi:hypothetical protein
MANCPNCGSTHVQLVRETNINWGRAVAGWALFGVVGGAVGAVTGEDRNVISCLDCGTTWKASDLYRTLQLVKQLTDITLDLYVEEDRFFLNTFILEINPYIEANLEAKTKADKLIKDIELRRNAGASQGCGFGCLTSMIGCSAIAGSSMAGSGFLILLIIPVIGALLGTLVDGLNKKYIEQELDKAKKKAAWIIRQAEDELQLKIEDLIEEYEY